MAVCAAAQTAAPFPVVEVETPHPQPHLGAYLMLGSGAALIGASFLIADHANVAYDAYLRETDPANIETLYDRAVMDDRLSSTSLISGELLIVGGLYWRFLRPAHSSRLSLGLGPSRCALSLRF